MRPPRRRQTVRARRRREVQPVEDELGQVQVQIPDWVRSFDPADWPERPGREPPRMAWNHARARWCRERGLSLTELARAGEVVGRYDHLRAEAGP